MIAAGVVPISIGTDIGGSIRIPALFNGVFGFKPTGGRISQEGILFPSKTGFSTGALMSFTCPGPFAKSARDCAEFFNVMCRNGDQPGLSYLTAPTPFRREMMTQIVDHP